MENLSKSEKFIFERSKIPINPGVYIYKDRFGKIIYIGKAKNLRSRVSSYFTSDHTHSPKTRILVNNIYNVEFFIVDNEVESLILENKLIKKNKPKYNILLKDSKTYPYIKLTADKIPKLALTRRVSDKGELFGPFVDSQVRNDIFNLTVSLFGLITSKTYSTKSSLNYDIGLAPARTLSEVDLDLYLEKVTLARDFLKGKNVSLIKKNLKSEMVECSKDMKFEEALIKKKQLDSIEILLEKQKIDLVKNYDQDVVGCVLDTMNDKAVFVLLNISKGVISSKKEFKFDLDNVEDTFLSFVKMFYSQAYIPREILVSSEFWKDEGEHKLLEEYLSGLAGRKVILNCPSRGEKKSLVELAISNAKLNVGAKNVLFEVKEKLGLRNVPRIIEVFDMSNLSYDFLVGGMTRWVDEKPDKSGYRKFDIKSFSGKNDDFAAMEECVYRRYSRLVNENAELPVNANSMNTNLNTDSPMENGDREKQVFPDLILIDGGLGQFGVARKVLKDLGLLKKIDLISIGKGAERKKNDIYTLKSTTPLVFDEDLKFMLFLRKVRDSVHNFVILHNRKKRTKKLEAEFE
jgi:excinuclease ABC subunit C